MQCNIKCSLLCYINNFRNNIELCWVGLLLYFVVLNIECFIEFLSQDDKMIYINVSMMSIFLC